MDRRPPPITSTRGSAIKCARIKRRSDGESSTIRTRVTFMNTKSLRAITNRVIVLYAKPVRRAARMQRVLTESKIFPIGLNIAASIHDALGAL